MKVYVVTQGRYSSYRIVGISLDRELAERAAEFRMKQGWHDQVQVDEWETDEFNKQAFTCLYEVWFSSDNGSIILCEEQPWLDQEVTTKFVVYVFAENEEQAKKIAIDRRAMYIAEKEGIA